MVGPTSIEWWSTRAYNGRPEQLLAVEAFAPLAHAGCRTVAIQADSGQNLWLRILARPFAPMVSTWGQPCQSTGGEPPWDVDPAVYSVCNGVSLRAYDSTDGYVRWGQMAWAPGSEPEPGGWTDSRLPRRIGAARLLWLHECRIMVRDDVGPLYLDFDGERWSVPFEGYSTHLPLVGR
jgi:hypothetical protein